MSTSKPHPAGGDWQGLSRPFGAGDVVNSVRSLLLVTRQLQDTLKEWSVGQVDESRVSDVYVRVCNDLEATYHAFAHHQIDFSEVQAFPKDLRYILERCLGEVPSPEILASYMPEVHQVLLKLLQSLQSKQHAWKAVNKSKDPYQPPPEY